MSERTRMPVAENKIASVGVPCRERRAKAEGSIPRSAMPMSWKESALISPKNIPMEAMALSWVGWGTDFGVD